MSAFSLKPYEDQVPGVQFRDGRLRLRPTWAATTFDLYGAAVGLCVAGVGVAVHNAVIVIAGFAGAVLLLPYLRCRVVAEGGSIVVVNKWRRSTLDVDDTTGVNVTAFRPASFVPFRDPFTLWPRTLIGCSLLVRDGGVLRCDALVGLPRDADSADPSPIEVKTAILQRWIECSSTTLPDA
jgi:hypothetical protein